MLIAVVVLLGLLAATFAALYWRGLREARSLSEYAQHLLLEPESYADHRGGYAPIPEHTARRSDSLRPFRPYRFSASAREGASFIRQTARLLDSDRGAEA